jgi:pyridinium-3,5-bisthiocarboxylic acid mononucleotide nickel chelatase
MNIAYLDCFSGISGDMVLGAFLDLGLPRNLLRETLKKMALPDLGLSIRQEERGGLSGTSLRVKEKHPGHSHRSYRVIKGIIEKSKIERQVKENSLLVLKNLAGVEARIHGQEIEEIHFHEIGALDTIVDIVGAALGFHYFQIQVVTASPVPVNQGWIKSQHGPLPLPAPATLALLKNVPVVPSGLEMELVTPTGAAILTTFAASFGPPPAATLKKIGYGLGQQHLDDRPNALRIWLGEKPAFFAQEKLIVLETNIDDMNPQWYDFVMERLFEAGALDVILIPCQMKKNRPGTLLQVLAKPTDQMPLRDILFRETTTLGLRIYEVSRCSLDRTMQSVRTPWGSIKIKKPIKPHSFSDRPLSFSVEYEDLKKIALKEKVPLKIIDLRIRSWLLKKEY